jgi:hypothetical protein
VASNSRSCEPYTDLGTTPLFACEAGERPGNMIEMADVILDLASAPDEPILVAVKLTAPLWELNFRATPDELVSLDAIRDTDWATRQCLHVGECAGSRVHWSADGDTATIMVGDDDETWDFAVTAPLASIDRIVADASTGRW